MIPTNDKPVPLGGVVTVPQPEIQIADQIHRQVAAILGTLPEDARGAIVGVGTAKGVNLAIAYKLDSGWRVGAYIGKSGWDQPIDGGVVVQKVFR